VGIVEFARSPWGQDVPIHALWYLIYVSAAAGLIFLVVHAVWARYFAGADEFAPSAPVQASRLPERVKRHSFAARAFHWIMAASMFALLITAFLPKVGVKFDWVEYHWIAGIVLIASILFHIIHATFFMDFWAIWPDKQDIQDAGNRLKLFLGKSAPLPKRFAKYPLENKMYHMAIVVTGLSVAITGFFMMFRVQTPFFTRNPYMFGDMMTGLMYVVHGLAGIGLIALITIHVYFAVRPEKLDITKSMIFGTLSREQYLEHHDPERWVVAELGKAAQK